MKVPYVLAEDPMALFAPTNQPRVKCEKTQLKNSFDKILDEDVRYSVAVESIIVGETDGYGQSVCTAFMFILYIQLGISKKAWSNIFTNSETVSSNFR